jgi:hypothetical protein
MEMNEFLKLFYQEFDSSSEKTDQWIHYYRVARNLFKKKLSLFSFAVGIKEGHFYFYGFFTENKSEQVYYFNVPDVRGNDGYLLLRTAKDYKDYTGGFNQFIKIDENLFDEIKKRCVKN